MKGSGDNGSGFEGSEYILLLVSTNAVTVKPVLSGHPRDPRYCPLNRGFRLVQVRFTENKGRKIGLY